MQSPVHSTMKSALLLALTALPAALFSPAFAADLASDDAGHRLAEVTRRFVPDKRTTFFASIPCGEALCVRTTSRPATESLSGLKGVRVTLLPDATIDGQTAGVIRVPVAAIHRSNAFSSEIITEAVLGTPVKLLEKKGWWHVQTPDGYLGWVHALQVTPMTPEAFRAHQTKAQEAVVTFSAPVYAESTRKTPVLELPNGALVTRTNTVPQNGHVEIALPDGRTGWVAQWRLKPRAAIERRAEQLLKTPQAVRERVADHALALLGRTYRWAGASVWGMDCSGLVKTAWRMAGLDGPRDADQMARLAGRLPDGTTTFQKGDLLFFGKTGVSHVGISLGGTRFVHSLGDVHVSDLDPQSPLYDAWAAGVFRFAVRPEFDDHCLTSLGRIPLYQGVAEPMHCDRPTAE